MIKNNKTKKAMSLLSILALMMVVMTAIIVATPIITKRLTQIHTRSNDEKGYFLCYKFYDNDTYDTQLKQIRADIYDTGTIFSPASGIPQQVNECEFEIPEGVKSFKITLIGGGGGGASGYCASSENDTYILTGQHPEMNFSTGKISYLSSNFLSFLGNTDKIIEYFNNNNLYLYTYKQEEDGTNEYTCLIPVATLLANEGYFNGGENLNLTYNIETATINNASKNIIKTITVNNNKTYPVTCTDNKINTYIDPNNKIRLVERTGDTTVNADNIPQIYKLYAGYKSYTAFLGGSGQAGDINIINTPFLKSANNTNIITIPQRNIGNGGNGASTASGAGETGGNTTLSVKIATETDDNGQPIFPDAETRLTASGGKGGQSAAKTNPQPQNATRESIFAGETGHIQDSNPIPSILASKIGVIQGGKGGEILNSYNGYSTDTNSVIKKDLTLNGGQAIYAGAGGGSAALACRKQNYCPTLIVKNNDIVHNDGRLEDDTDITCPGHKNSIQYSYGNGGKGAGGAILIEW